MSGAGSGTLRPLLPLLGGGHQRGPGVRADDAVGGEGMGGLEGGDRLGGRVVEGAVRRHGVAVDGEQALHGRHGRSALAGADGLFVAKEIGGDTVDLVGLFALHGQALYDTALRMIAESEQR